ncbi:hypothetical protein Cfor_11895 [Coptotermes formosanus]|uniref:Fatty acid hydroxylase domain-containing protein n=1 Tax=Coptotermes formosanus TaxID=36987 RepID=A0A6L2PTM3_COPFO|nr:hypothetical protein Cfor_11895 [Coptotermes formosanus]
MEEFQSATALHHKKTVQDASGAQQPTLFSSLWSVLFVTSSALIGLAAFRNTLTWHLQRFWGASGDFWQAQWDRLLDVTGEDLFTLWVYGTTILTLAVYWIIGGMYTIMDITNKPAALRRYKIQPGTNEPVDPKRLMKARWVLFNQTVVTIPLAHSSYQMMMWRGSPPLRELPAFHWALVELAVNIIMVEIGFYYAHRLLHNAYLYRFIHKRHHEWTAPIAVTAAYCHPVEHIFANVLPLFLGPLIMGSHVATVWVWLSLAILITLNDHSGYHLPFLPSPEPHDFHHLKFNQCFGVVGLLDAIHGTDVMFRNSKSYTRHMLMLTLKPPREAFPDENKRKTKCIKSEAFTTAKSCCGYLPQYMLSNTECAESATAPASSNGGSDSLQNVGQNRLTHHERRLHTVKVACFEFILPVVNVVCYRCKVISLQCVHRARVSALVWPFLRHQTTKSGQIYNKYFHFPVQ